MRRIGFHYQEQKEADAKQKKYAFERVLLMEQQMNNGMSQKEACQNWGMQFHSEAYQKLALILVQSFTKGSKEASTMMEAEEREAFQRRVERSKAGRRGGRNSITFSDDRITVSGNVTCNVSGVDSVSGILIFKKIGGVS